MKKITRIVFYFIVLIAVGGIGWRLILNYVGDIRPALLPSPINVAQVVEDQELIEERTGTMPADFPFELPKGFKIGLFAKGLSGVRDLTFSKEGVLFASLTTQGKIVALPDKDKDGKADKILTAMTHLDQPHGITFYNNEFYAAEETKIVRYQWDERELRMYRERDILNLPAGGKHITRSVIFDKSGNMYVSIGSSCNVCFEKNKWLGSIIVTNSDGINPRIYASGLRNAVFMTINPITDQLWATEMSRDFLGDDAPPDEINLIQQDGYYGWPECYGDNIPDKEFDPKGEFKDRCVFGLPPAYKIPAHSAPLGLAFINSTQFPVAWHGDMLVAYHGSWNRKTPTGYKIVRMLMQDNKVIGSLDFITGFSKGSEAYGRPVDLTFDKAGNLYISDDKAGVIYRVTYSR